VNDSPETLGAVILAGLAADALRTVAEIPAALRVTIIHPFEVLALGVDALMTALLPMGGIGVVPLLGVIAAVLLCVDRYAAEGGQP